MCSRCGILVARRWRVMVGAERRALEVLWRICPGDVSPIIVADRGFGNTRWLADVQKRGWGCLQRLSHIHNIDVEEHLGTLKKLGITEVWINRLWYRSMGHGTISMPTEKIGQP